MGYLYLAPLLLLPLVALKFFVGQSVNWKKLLQNEAYAVVTGASDGIGKEFALQLAKKGFNIVILARTKAKLDKVAEEAGKYGVKVRVIPFDFATRDSKDYDKLRSELAQLNITVLVNNVGVSHDIPTLFVEEQEAMIEGIVQVNISSVLKVTRIVLPLMKYNRKGLVVNMGSFSGLAPAPFLSVYGASKAFISSWSRALSMELKPHGIHVQHLNTYFVSSAMSKMKPSYMVPSAKLYVQSALGDMGAGADITPYAPHKVMAFIVKKLIPGFILDKMMYSQLYALRKRALKRREKAEAKTK